MKTANFYKARPSELDKSLLAVIPDAPRVPQTGLPSNYDWSMFNDGTYQNSSNSKVWFKWNHIWDVQENVWFKILQNIFLKKSHSTFDSFIKLKDEDDDVLRHSSTTELSTIDNSLEAALWVFFLWIVAYSEFLIVFVFCFSIDTHRLSADEASIVAATGVENYIKYRNSIGNNPVTAAKEHQNGHTQVAEIIEIAEIAELSETDAIETNEGEIVNTEQIKTEDIDEVQKTAKLAGEPKAVDNTAEHNYNNNNNFGMDENGTEKVGTRDS